MNSKENFKWNDDSITYAINLYQMGLTLRDIRNLLKTSFSNVRNTLEKTGISFRSRSEINSTVCIGRIPWNKGKSKQTDARIAKIAKSKEGKKFKISKPRKRQYPLFPNCVECGDLKANSINKRCYKCAGKFRSRTYPGPTTGKKLSEEHKMALWSGLTSLGMTKPEKKTSETLEWLFGKLSPYRYTGNRTRFITFKTGRHKNPDFCSNTERKAIEVFGRYWHKIEEEQEIIDLYKGIGWGCLVLWEDNINAQDISKFTYPDEYENDLYQFQQENLQWYLGKPI